jgi:anti-sigma factor RsiW
MFNCKDSIGLLLALLDGEMSPEEERHLQEHLRGCGPCEEFMRSYRATPGLCKKALAARMPTEVSSKLTDFLRARCKPS